jgi:transposase
MPRGRRLFQSSSARLFPIDKRKVIPDRIVYSGGWKVHNVLDISDFKHFRIHHPELFSVAHNHISGTENFWGQEKRSKVFKKPL